MFRKIEAYVRHERLEEVRQALIEIGIPAMDTVEALGHGRQTDIKLAGRHSSYTVDTLPRIRLTVVVGKEDVAQTVEAIRQAAATGTQGDGVILVCPIENMVVVTY